VILAQGDAAKPNERKSSAEIAFLKQKDGEFVGRFLTANFVKFRQHSQFIKPGSPQNVQSHACIDPKHRKDCPSCAKGVPSKEKWLVWWYDLTNKRIVVRDVSYTAMKDTVWKLRDEYGEDLTTDVFTIALGDKGALSIIAKKVKKGEEFAPTPADVAAMFADGQIDMPTLAYAMNYLEDNAEIEKLIAHFKPATTEGDSNAPVVETTSDPTSGF
jgi:hypothetical protein